MGKTAQQAGKQFEMMIEQANQVYKLQGKALIMKAEPTVKTFGKGKGEFSKSVYAKSNGLDYFGSLQGGRGVFFEAKQTAETSFPLKQIKTHQVELFHAYEKLDALAFLLVEAGEMINETKTFKYWSNKRMDPKKVLEEAIDWLHFYCSLLMTDYPKKTPRAIEYDRAQFDRQTFVLQNETLDYLYINLLQASDRSKMLAAWSLILEQLGYTEEDILNMYEQKNSTNYVRIAEGY